MMEHSQVRERRFWMGHCWWMQERDEKRKRQEVPKDEQADQ
jgi:hypothetical protein